MTRHRFVPTILGPLMLAAAGAACQQAPAGPAPADAAALRSEAAAARGARLFAGTVPLEGWIRGETQLLPPGVPACANCHTLAAPAAVPVPTALSAPSVAVAAFPAGPGVAPRLGPWPWLGAHARRGGAPTAYTADTFCRALRTGLDPSGAPLDAGMPVYRLGDADCAVLWQFLSTTVPR
jgi:hypothetical protein